MKFVQPIRDVRVIEGLKQYFWNQSVRNFLFFCLGIYSGLRVTDLLSLTAGAVRNKTHITIREGKTGKIKKFIIHPDIKDVLEQYIADMNDDEYLFASRQKKTISGEVGSPIHRSTAYKMLNTAAKEFNLTEIGCHTMRKTWGYHLYMQDPTNIALLMHMFNHSTQAITLMYLGLTQDAMDKAVLRLSYSKKRIM
ncbi:tyrosine-type recombinase/integrase [Paenibacillus aquistagni]|uniref:Phage integrase family protein n=1 Tax=Paenibacillus aquistagni TaxID=1852522 RepID=A0A1X7LYC0_9BACL|nr:tyrosine-type recombinase/integrase [Paenibacillus aquistagni]SMG58273.1 Phage integrase family protein [Paenibacillus aquistagni]